MAYTPGYSANATAFMARRSLGVQGAFVVPLLRDGLQVLDLGCGPGSMTVELARRLPGGQVLGVDRDESQVGRARAAATAAGVANVAFAVGEADALALPPSSFDLIFSHALFEHLSSPIVVLQQLKEFLRPGGRVALRSPDWGGFLLHPETEACAGAMAAYEALQRRNGGDTHAGRKLAAWLHEAGYGQIRLTASYEIYPSADLIAAYLAQQLDAAGDEFHARVFRQWAQAPHSLFAQAWCEAIAQRP